MRINQSRVNSWRTCKQQHHFKYVEWLQPRRSPRPLAFGSLIHKMIEEDANNRDPFEVLDTIDDTTLKNFKENTEEYGGDLIGDIDIIMQAYFEYWGDSLKYLKVGDRRAEHKFKIEILPDVTWEGKIDAFTQTPNKLRWLMEHKSFKQMPDEDARWRNIQSTSYHRAVDIMGWPLKLDGTLWDYVWSTPPSVPQINKDLSISKRKMRTLPAKLREWAKSEKRKVPATLMKEAKEHQSDWFQRIYTTKKEKVIDRVYDDFIISAKEIVNRGEKEKVKSIGRWCSWCQYESICRAQLTGSDDDFIKNSSFTKRDPDERYND